MKPLHLSNRTIKGVKTLSHSRKRLLAACRGRDVVCHTRYLSHNQVEVARSVAASVCYVTN